MKIFKECTSCTAGDVTLVNGDVTPTATEPAVGEDDCLGMTVTCTANAGSTVSMTFQNGAGPANNGMEVVTADLVCANGVWTFTESGNTVEVSSVTCTPPVPCTLCKAEDINPSPPIVSPITMDANMCNLITVTCPASANGGFMTIGDFGIQYGPGETSSANLKCNANGMWVWTMDENVVVGSSECLEF